MIYYFLNGYRRNMADEAAAQELKKRRTFRKFMFRGVDLDQLLDMNHEQLMELFTCRIRRKFSRGMKVFSQTVVMPKKLSYKIQQNSLHSWDLQL